MTQPKDYVESYRDETEKKATRKALIQITAAAALALALGIGLRISEPPPETYMQTYTMADIPATSAALIRPLMEAGWTQKALAIRAGCSLNTIARASRGESELAYATAWRLVWLLTGDTEPPEKARSGPKPRGPLPEPQRHMDVDDLTEDHDNQENHE